MNCEICATKLAGRQRKYCSQRCKFRSQNIRNQNYEKQKERAETRKKEAIRQFGGECQECGYSKNYAVLSFHHARGVKSFGLDSRAFSNLSQKKIDTELEKCDLLCIRCHGELHHPGCLL